MAKIIVREMKLVSSTPHVSGGYTAYYSTQYDNVAVIEIECPDESFDQVWSDLKNRGLIPDENQYVAGPK